MNNPEQITYFGETDARNKRLRFGIKSKDRTRHVYIIGKTGMGKSTVLENMAVQDIQNGNGFAFMDPHGKTAELLLEYIPEERKKDVMYFAPFDSEYPIGFNIMEDVGFNRRHLVVSGIMSTFKKIWVDAWSSRMEYILTNALLALLEYPDSTLLSVNKMLSDKKFREDVIKHITDPAVRAFWVDEFGSWTDRYIAESVPAIQNKIGQFTGNPIIRNIIGQPKSTFDLREMMDDNKIIIVNLSKGQIGEVNANLLGSMLITKIYLAAMSRADRSEEELDKLPNFYLYVDEFQSFANDSFADILSEARKYKLNLTIAHQYIEQMEDVVRAAVFGNVGTMVTFRVGAYDADVLEKEFAPVFLAEDIVNLGKFQIYLKLMIDGIGSKPFSAATMVPIPKPEINLKQSVIASSREQFGSDRAGVEEIASKILLNNQDKKEDRSDKSEHKKKTPKKNDQNKGEKKKEEVKQPFRDVFNTDDFKNNIVQNAKEQLKKERGSSSIEEIQLKNLKNQKKKGPSEENKNALKDALRSVLGSIPEDSKENKKEEPKKQQEERKSAEEIPKNQDSKGISDQVLKDLLKITSEDL